MYQSMIMNPEDTNLRIGDKVRILPFNEIKKNIRLYGFEECGDVDYEDLIDMDLIITEISTEKIREDLVVVSLRIVIDEKYQEKTWLYYMLEVEAIKSKFLVELL